MGKSVTPPYRLEIRVISGAHYTPLSWDVKSGVNRTGCGKPTVANIDKWVTAFEASMLTHNKHLGIDQVTFAKVIDQRTGEVVATWVRKEQRKSQPLFQII